MLNILILGGNGFIGKNLKEYFATKDDLQVWAPGRSELNCLSEEAVEDYLRSHHFDIVIHGAIFVPHTPEEKVSGRILENDLRMFYNFQKYSDLYGKMFYFGSGAEYDKRTDIKSVKEYGKSQGGKQGRLSDNMPAEEKDIIKEPEEAHRIPDTEYGFAKYIIHQQILKSENIYNFRVFGLFGKYENWRTTFISGACCKAVSGLPISIRKNVYFDYLYIDDFCKICDRMMRKELKYHEYNMCSGRKYDLLSLAKIVAGISEQKTGKRPEIFVCQEGLAPEYTASNERLLEEIGGYEFLSIEQAVEQLYQWYEQHSDIIEIYPLLYQ